MSKPEEQIEQRRRAKPRDGQTWIRKPFAGPAHGERSTSEMTPQHANVIEDLSRRFCVTGFVAGALGAIAHVVLQFIADRVTDEQSLGLMLPFLLFSLLPLVLGTLISAVGFWLARRRGRLHWLSLACPFGFLMVLLVYIYWPGV